MASQLDCCPTAVPQALIGGEPHLNGGSGSLGGSALARQDKKVRSLKLFGPHTHLEHNRTRARPQTRSDDCRVAYDGTERALLLKSSKTPIHLHRTSIPDSGAHQGSSIAKNGRLRPHRDQRWLCAVQSQRQVHYQGWQRRRCRRRAQAEAVPRKALLAHCTITKTDHA